MKSNQKQFSLTGGSLKERFSIRNATAWLRLGNACTLPLLLLLALSTVVQAQYTYTNDNDTITITGYTGPGGLVTIPGTLAGLPVTSIGDYAFQIKASLTSITI